VACAAEGAVVHDPGRAGPQEGPEVEQRPQEEEEQLGLVGEGQRGQQCWLEAAKRSTRRHR
jgi:hypothetical protein